MEEEWLIIAVVVSSALGNGPIEAFQPNDGGNAVLMDEGNQDRPAHSIYLFAFL